MGEIWPKPLGKGILWDRMRELLPSIDPSPFGRLPSGFRLIDVEQRRCVTVGPTFDGTFAALSYVWGSAMGVAQAGPAFDLHNPPHTIEDALHVCQQLRQKYLWVDQICIKQDDPTDKANQISCMAAIYSSASFVIVAAHGESVHSGISGMHLARGNLQARESFLHFQFASGPHFGKDISSSIWSTRGWTLQEVVLTKIRLYFSSTGVWLNFTEDRLEFWHSVEFDRRITLSTFMRSPFFDFCEFLQRYTPRKLTYEYDIYNAFSGIITALFGGPDRDICGLPEQNFDHALLWAPSPRGPPPSIRVLQNNSDRDRVQNPLLPSWSWASVRGEVGVTRASGDMVALVKWAHIAPSAQLPTPILIEPQLEEFPWDDKLNPRFCLAVLWSYLCFDSPSPFAPHPPNNTGTNLGDLTLRWPSPRDFWHEITSGGSRSPTYPELGISGLTGEDDFKIAQLRPGILLTRAQSAHLWLDPNGYLRNSDHGARIGQLYGEHRGLVLRGDSPKVGVFKCVAISLSDGEGQNMKIVLESRTRLKRPNFTLSDEENWDIFSAEDPGNLVKYTPFINVMLIGSEGPFSYRLGIGWVLFQRWIDIQRVFETILLK